MPSLLVLQGPDKGLRIRTPDVAAPAATSPASAPPSLFLGRSSPDAPLTDFTVSRRHAEIRPSGSGGRAWVIEDLRSANGTYLNGKRLERPTRLKHGDQIKLGGTLMVWDSSEERTLSTADKQPPLISDLVDLGAGPDRVDASILGSVNTADDSMILASPAAAEAVRSWRVMSALLDAVGAILSPQQLVERVLDLLFEEIPGDRALVLLKDEKSGKFDTQVVRHRDEGQGEEGRSSEEKRGEAQSADARRNRMRPNRMIISHVIERAEGVLCSNTTADPRFSAAEREPGAAGVGLQSVICVPLLAREQVLGVIYVECAMARHIYTEEQLRLVAAIGQMAGLAVEDVRLVDQRMRTERLAATGETVAALSHYIKNILQGMMGGSDVVEMGSRDRNWDMVDQGWQVVRRNLDKIYSLSLNMLAYAKRRTPRLAPVQLNAIVEDVLKLVQRRAADKGVLLKSDLADDVPAVLMDEDGIHQVALNIVANAIDAVPRMSGAVTVKTSLDAGAATTPRNTGDGWVVLTVGDNGPGMTRDVAEKIFDAFYSTKGHGGTGLGLAVARKIIDEHSGKIEVRSVEGEGTIIRVRLPIARRGDIDSAETHGAGMSPEDTGGL